MHTMNPKPQLFLLHFAGGNGYSYNFLTPHLTTYFDVHVLELPGRGKRINEPLIRDYALAVSDLYNQLISKRTEADYLIYGHSMGATLALALTEKIEQEIQPPLHIIVSGNPGPGIKDKRRYDIPKELFLQELKALGGMPNEFFENDELYHFFEPILRADFEVLEKDALVFTNCKIKAPIYAVMGNTEECALQINNWQNYTSGLCQTTLLTGNHFFIHQYSKKLAAIIKNCYDRSKVLQY